MVDSDAVLRQDSIMYKEEDDIADHISQVLTTYLTSQDSKPDRIRTFTTISYVSAYWETLETAQHPTSYQTWSELVVETTASAPCFLSEFVETLNQHLLLRNGN